MRIRGPLRLLIATSVQVLAPALALAWCVGGAPPARDADEDGLNDIQEQFFGTDPADADSDDDGVIDSDEDFDGDGITNADEPTLFSLEMFEDPFTSRARRFGLVLEGTNLFDAVRGARRATVGVLSTGRAVPARLVGKLNGSTRIYLRLNPQTAARLLGETLDGRLEIRTPLGATNTLHPVPMPCPPGPPKLMGAAKMQFRSRVMAGGPIGYIVIGGCNLVDRNRRRIAVTRVRLDTHDIVVRAPYGGVGMLPSRIIVPMHSRELPDPLYPFSDDIAVGDTVRVANAAGVSNPVVVEPTVAQLRIPRSNLLDDHDQDMLSSLEELQRGTDPLIFDTDRDGLPDGIEAKMGVTSPLDRDSDGDGIVDGRE